MAIPSPDGIAMANDRDFLPNSFDEVVTYRLGVTDRFFLPRALVMHDRDNGRYGVAVVLNDVTRFRLLDAAKTNLVATVSHELKTPLTGLRMALHLLTEKTVGELLPKQEELLQGAQADAERLLRILNDLLDLARLDAGDAELHRESTAPSGVVQGIIDRMRSQARAAGVKLTGQADAGLPPVLIDQQRIYLVFTNLVSNAIKHSGPGGEVTIHATRNNDDGVQFAVSDQGPGIPAEFHSRIFDRFFRVPGQDKAGAGLGLSIAREIVVAHGGRIGLKSSLNRGSTFFVVLPASD